MLFPIFFSPKQKLYYFKGEEVCNSCGGSIENDLICNIQWRRKQKPCLNCYCLNCHTNIKDYGGEVKENFICVVSKLIPEDAYPIFPRPPILINYRGESVFDAAFSNSEAEIIDNTVLAGRSDPAAALEFQKHQQMLEKKDQELKEKIIDVDKFLEEAQTSVPLIEEEERKQLKQSPNPA